MSWDSKELMDAVRRRRAADEADLQARALKRARDIASFLKKHCGVKEVILYGSLAEGRFHEMSDIDLLIDGHEVAYWDLYAESDRLASPFPLSLVTQKEASPSLLEKARSKGVVL